MQSKAAQGKAKPSKPTKAAGEPTKPTNQQTNQPTNQPSKQASEQASKRASKEASKQRSKQLSASKQASKTSKTGTGRQANATAFGQQLAWPGLTAGANPKCRNATKSVRQQTNTNKRSFNLQTCQCMLKSTVCCRRLERLMSATKGNRCPRPRARRAELRVQQTPSADYIAVTASHALSAKAGEMINKPGSC